MNIISIIFYSALNILHANIQLYALTYMRYRRLNSRTRIYKMSKSMNKI